MGKANAKVIEMAKDFKEKTRKKYGIRKMILFGSQSRGDAGMDSDIDFIIVADRIKKKHEFMSKLLTEWHIVQGKKYPVDFFCLTTAEFKRKSCGITIVREAVREGIAI